ncbi:MAG: head GIN domain-containing protein, partial [Bacteroidales bacterium]
DENLHVYIITEIKGDELYIRHENDINVRGAEKERVYVTMKDIKSLSTSSAGDIIGETPVKSDNLELNASSAGDIKLEVYAKEIKVDASSSGDITLNGETDMIVADLSSAGDLNAYNLKTKEANVTVSSAGDADIFVTDKLTARSSSAGDVNYKGDPKIVDAHSSSAGGIHKK